MPRHHRLRFAVLTAVTAGALLVPAAAAFASDGNPTPSAKASEDEKTADAMKRAAAAKNEAAKRARMSKQSADKEMREAEARKAEAAKRAGAADAAPRGGVAAGEAPAGNTNMTTLVGSATGALLLAGAGTLVLRRRSAERHNA